MLLLEGGSLKCGLDRAGDGPLAFGGRGSDAIRRADPGDMARWPGVRWGVVIRVEASAEGFQSSFLVGGGPLDCGPFGGGALGGA